MFHYKLEEKPMKISVQSLHFDADHKLLEFIQQKCNKLDMFYDQVIDANVILRIDKDHEHGNKVAEIVMNVPGSSLVSKNQSKSFEESIDLIMEQSRKQLIKFKERQRTHVA